MKSFLLYAAIKLNALNLRIARKLGNPATIAELERDQRELAVISLMGDRHA